MKLIVGLFFTVLSISVSVEAKSSRNTDALIPIIQLLLLDESGPASIANTCTAGFIKDIDPGSANGQLTTQDSQFTQLGDQVYFRADTVNHGIELWVTDGSTAGTRLVRDVEFGTSDALGIGDGMLTAIDDNLLFRASTSANGSELWRSDGSSNGTQIVRDVGLSSSDTSPQALTHFNGKIYYLSTGISDFAIQDEGLWVSDGTFGGTQLVRDTHQFNRNTGASERMAVVNNRLIFRADGETSRQEPWVSDGTSSNTHLLKDIAPGSANSQADGFTTIGNKVYFFANDGEHGMELWVTDGTSINTFMVKDIHPGPVSGVQGNNFTFTSKHFLEIDGSAVFLADDGVHGQELWISDGTNAGTRMIRDIAIGSEDGISSSSIDSLDHAAALNGKVYFQADANDQVNSNRELWVTDGTHEGTRLFADLNSNNSSAPEHIFATHGLIFMSADGDSNLGDELWVLDEMGRSIEFNLNLTGSSRPEHFFNFNGQILFFADTGSLGRELWGINCDF